MTLNTEIQVYVVVESEQSNRTRWTVNELRQTFDCSQATVRKALGELENKNLIRHKNQSPHYYYTQ